MNLIFLLLACRTPSPPDDTAPVPDTAVDACGWLDFDGDGYGDPGFPLPCDGSIAGPSSTDPSDCDDADPTVHPGAREVCDDVDDDCDD